ncbi:MAG: DUF1272 domain-containing protein [Bacteroidota bacterium]
MLEMRPNCENCDKALPNDSHEAMICTFECTFCTDCVEKILHNVCPNCGGGFTKRPSRPKALLDKYPVSQKRVFKPIDPTAFQAFLTQYQHIPAHER